MEKMAEEFADRAVSSVFLYAREAHPGENYGHHRSMDDKRHHARAFIEHSKLKRPVLLDDLRGTAHRAFGILPNMTWIFGRGGLILYKSAWTDPVDIRDALATGLDGASRRVKDKLMPFYSERQGFREPDHDDVILGLARTGPKAVREAAASHGEAFVKKTFARIKELGVDIGEP
jgi:hypothetical protein